MLSYRRLKVFFFVVYFQLGKNKKITQALNKEEYCESKVNGVSLATAAIFETGTSRAWRHPTNSMFRQHVAAESNSSVPKPAYHSDFSRHKKLKQMKNTSCSPISCHHFQSGLIQIWMFDFQRSVASKTALLFLRTAIYSISSSSPQENIEQKSKNCQKWQKIRFLRQSSQSSYQKGCFCGKKTSPIVL